jgi:hypothetical protein
MPGSSEFNAMDSGMRRNDGLIRGSLNNKALDGGFRRREIDEHTDLPAAGQG